MATSSFKKCSKCPNVLPDNDGHDLCLACLGEAHLYQSCAICQSFTPQTRKNRILRLKAALYERALLPSSDPIRIDPPVGEAVAAKKKLKKAKDKMLQNGRTAMGKKTAALGSTVGPSSAHHAAMTPSRSKERSEGLPLVAEKTAAATPVQERREGDSRSSGVTPPMPQLVPNQPPPMEGLGVSERGASAVPPVKAMQSKGTGLQLTSCLASPSTFPNSVDIGEAASCSRQPISRPEACVDVESAEREERACAILPIGDERLREAGRVIQTPPPGVDIGEGGGDSALAPPPGGRAQQRGTQPSLPPESSEGFESVSPRREMRRGSKRPRRSRSPSRQSSRSRRRRYRSASRGGARRRVPSSSSSSSSSSASRSPTPPPRHSKRSRKHKHHYYPVPPYWGRPPMGFYPHPSYYHEGHLPHMSRHAPEAADYRCNAVQRQAMGDPGCGVHPADVRGPSTSAAAQIRPLNSRNIRDGASPATAPSANIVAAGQPADYHGSELALARSTLPLNDVANDEPTSHRAQGDSTPQVADCISQAEGNEQVQGHLDSSSEDSDVPDFLCQGDTEGASAMHATEINKFNVLVGRMIKALDLPAPKVPEHVDDPMFPSDEQVSSPATTLPILPYLLKLARVVDMSPSLVPAIPKRLDMLYKIDVSSNKWVVTPPRPNTVVAEVAKTKRPKNTLTTPPDREGKKVDTLGKKAHISAGLLTRMAHYATYLSGYQSFLWTKILPYIDALPAERQRFPKAIQAEAMILSRIQKDFAKHLAEMAGNLYATATSIRRHAWLRSANLSEEGRALAEDLPFHEEGLFNPETDSRIKEKQDVRQAANKFGYTWQPYSQQKQRWHPYSSNFRRNSGNSFTGQNRNRSYSFNRGQAGRRNPYFSRPRSQNWPNKGKPQGNQKKRL
ncbi:serine/arginine repetitive matrix protein 1-like [Anolis sagrei]|uniref:serine/arginine repetitive matrix protein 1-like n=1 Tax=Anolis sagrei TaxID=38937 RepID=UPI003520C9C6